MLPSSLPWVDSAVQNDARTNQRRPYLNFLLQFLDRVSASESHENLIQTEGPHPFVSQHDTEVVEPSRKTLEHLEKELFSQEEPSFDLFEEPAGFKDMGILQLKLVNGQISIMVLDREVTKLFEYCDESELIGKNCDILFPSPYKEQIFLYVSTLWSHDKGKPPGSIYVEGVTKHKKIFPIQISWVDENMLETDPLCVALFLAPVRSFDGCVLLTTQDGKIVAESATSTFGYERNLLLRQNITNLLPAVTFPVPKNILRNEQCLQATGELVPACVSVEPINDNTLIKFLILPITENETAFLTMNEKGLILSCSSIYTPLLLGYSCNEVQNKSITSIFQLCSDSSHEHWWKSKIDTNPSTVLAKHKDGSLIKGLLTVALFNYYNIEYYALAFTREENTKTTDLTYQLQIDVENVTELGHFTKLVLGSHHNTKEQIAIKIFYKQLMKPEERIVMMKEIEMLKRLDHPGIVKTRGVIQTNKKINLFVEYLAGGSLNKFLEENNRLSENHVCDLFAQMAEGVYYCHGKNITGIDLKTSSFFFIDDRKTKLKCVDIRLRNAFTTTSPFFAPEMLSGGNYDGSLTDVWSLGVMLFEMSCGYLPFEDFKDVIEVKSAKMVDTLSSNCCDLIARMLTVAEDRITLWEVLMHSFFESKASS